MLDYLIILLISLLAYTGFHWWVILLGAAGLSVDTLYLLYQILKKRPPPSLDWNHVTFFSAILANNIAVSSAAYLAGFLGHRVTG